MSQLSISVPDHRGVEEVRALGDHSVPGPAKAATAVRVLRARKPQRAGSVCLRTSQCSLAWIRAVSASLPPFHRCRSAAEGDRALADACSSSNAGASGGRSATFARRHEAEATSLPGRDDVRWGQYRAPLCGLPPAAAGGLCATLRRRRSRSLACRVRGTVHGKQRGAGCCHPHQTVAASQPEPSRGD
jgi:hypothetical protein